jgi:hypothetical protein
MGGNAVYYRNLTAERRLSRIMRATKLTPAADVIKSRAMLRQIRRWINLRGIDYAKDCLYDLGVKRTEIPQVIDAVQSYKRKRGN